MRILSLNQYPELVPEREFKESGTTKVIPLVSRRPWAARLRKLAQINWNPLTFDA